MHVNLFYETFKTKLSTVQNHNRCALKGVREGAIILPAMQSRAVAIVKTYVAGGFAR